MAGDRREVSTSTLVDTKQAGAKRRRWPEAVKRDLVAATFEPGSSVSIVARRHDVNANLLFKWRRQFGGSLASAEPVTLLPVEIAPSPAPVADSAASQSAPVLAAGTIEVTMSGGVRVRIRGAVDPMVVSAAVGAVMATRRRR